MPCGPISIGTGGATGVVKVTVTEGTGESCGQLRRYVIVVAVAEVVVVEPAPEGTVSSMPLVGTIWQLMLGS